MPHPLARGIIAGVVIALIAAQSGLARAAEPPIRVFAAASLTEVMRDLAGDFAGSGAHAPMLVFAASSTLARQIEAGAPADVFISADEEWMDYLAARDLIRSGSRRLIAGNRLVLIAPATRPVRLRLGPDADILGALSGGRLACADPDSVPAGRYARSALMSLGLWNTLADRLARAENVRAALMWVARGEAPLGIVYETDARAEPGVDVVDTFGEETHLPIRYPAAALRNAPAAADDFLRFLGGTVARERLRQRGFTSIPAETATSP